MTIESVDTVARAEAARVPFRYTYAQAGAELFETNRPCDLWEGELVASPSFSFIHQEALLGFHRQLHAWVAWLNLGKVTTDPLDMVLSESCVTQPDVAYLSRHRLSIVQQAIIRLTDLVAQVVSLGARSRDRIKKRDLYEQYSGQKYWILDPESKNAGLASLEGNGYRLVVRCGVAQTAASRQLSAILAKPRTSHDGIHGRPSLPLRRNLRGSGTTG